MNRQDKHLDDGRDRRDAGMALASTPIERRLLIARQQLELLDAIERQGAATTDDVAGDLAASYPDGGRWRGSVVLELARNRVIARQGYVPSKRPSRHVGPVAVWKFATTPDVVSEYRNYLRHLIVVLQPSA